MACRKCRVCQEEGHDKRTCPKITTSKKPHTARPTKKTKQVLKPQGETKRARKSATSKPGTARRTAHFREFLLAFRRSHFSETMLLQNFLQELSLPLVCNTIREVTGKRRLKMSTVAKRIEKEYRQNVRESSAQTLKHGDFVYSGMKFLFTREDRCDFYQLSVECPKGSLPCFAKCFFRVFPPDDYELTEFKVHQELTERHNLSIPRLFPLFETEDYRCYPMEKLDSCVSDLLDSDFRDGFGFERTLEIANAVIPVIQVIHRIGYYYVDFSPGNLGYLDKKPVLFDFGSARPQSSQLPASRFTPRYASARMLNSFKPEIEDDYESLAYVLFDVWHGIPPLGCEEHLMNEKKLHTIPFFQRYLLLLFSPFSFSLCPSDIFRS